MSDSGHWKPAEFVNRSALDIAFASRVGVEPAPFQVML
jgi:hypothetical protein